MHVGSYEVKYESYEFRKKSSAIDLNSAYKKVIAGSEDLNTGVLDRTLCYIMLGMILYIKDSATAIGRMIIPSHL